MPSLVEVVSNAKWPAEPDWRNIWWLLVCARQIHLHVVAHKDPRVEMMSSLEVACA